MIKEKNDNKGNLTKKQLFRKSYDSKWEDNFGHYFRHLFLMVKFVVLMPEKFLPREKKRDYLRILRASLSTYEQIFLYYNWLSGYAKQWEDEKYHFFTDYRMIHNINPNLLIQDFNIKNISPFKELLSGAKAYDKENDNDSLFEFEDW